MLFRTVYGPELAEIYFHISKFEPLTIVDVFKAFGAFSQGSFSSTMNLEDAVSFLKATGIVYEESGNLLVEQKVLRKQQFCCALLSKIRGIQVGQENNTENCLDAYFMKIIDILYIKPDVLFHTKLHMKINALDIPIPCSIEKVNAWRRVHEYLGVGIRAYNGLFVSYRKDLVLEIINEWDLTDGPLQVFMEEHFNKYLPWKSDNLDIAKAVSGALLELEVDRVISLTAKQDLPNKSYFGERRIKWICKEKV